MSYRVTATIFFFGEKKEVTATATGLRRQDFFEKIFPTKFFRATELQSYRATGGLSQEKSWLQSYRATELQGYGANYFFSANKNLELQRNEETKLQSYRMGIPSIYLDTIVAVP